MKLLPFLVLLIACACHAANVYICDGVSGAGTSWSDALDDLPATLTRGNVYYIADGKYAAYDCDDLESGASVITIRKATQQDHGTETGWQSAYGDGQAVFGFINIFTDNWVIDGVVGGGPGSWTSGHGIRINGGVGVNLPWNPVYDWTLGHGDNVTLRHLELVSNVNFSEGGDAVGAAFTSGLFMSYLYTRLTDNCPLQLLNVTNVLLEYSYIAEFCLVCSPAIHGEIMSADGCGDFVIRWNIFRWVESTGGLMFDNRHTPSLGMKVYGNVFYKAANETWSYGPAEGVIGNWDRDTNSFQNIVVYNNTFINVPQIALGPVSQVQLSNVFAKNNYFYNTGTGLPNSRWSPDYNHFQDSGGESETNGTAGTGNPFTNYPAMDFSLTVNTTPGTDLGAPYNVDMLGRTRTTWTRGAIEFSTGGTPPPPIEPPPPPPPTLIACHVHSFVVTKITAKTGVTGRATVIVRNGAGAPVAGAAIAVQWTGIVTGSATGTTNTNGQVILSSPKLGTVSGTATAAVTSVTPPSGYTYDPALVRTVALN